MTSQSARKYQSPLLDLLLESRSQGGMPRPVLFSALFQESYAPKRDYLLRNELRHLNQSLKSFIASLGMRTGGNRRGAGTVALLENLMAREAMHLFQLELRQALRQAEQLADVDMQLELLQLQARHLRKAIPNDKRLEQVRAHGHKVQALLQVQYLREKWKNLELLALSERNDMAAGYDTVLSDLQGPAAKDALVEDAYLQFLIAKSLAYHALGPAYIVASERALALLAGVRVPGVDVARERASLLSNIALGYYLQQDYATARKYFQQVLPLRAEIPPSTYSAILFNYISATVHDGAYAEASALIAREISAIRGNPQIEVRVAALEVASLLFLGEARKARLTLLPVLDQGSEVDHFYFRTCLMIAWFQEGEIESAIRENVNIAQALRRRGKLRLFRETALLFSHYLRVLDAQGKRNAARKWAGLASKLQAFQAALPGEARDTLPVKWIVDHILAEISKHN